MFLCVCILIGRNFLKINLFVGSFDVFNVVIVVYGFGRVLIGIFCLWYLCIKIKFGLLINGVLVLFINVIDLLFFKCL